MINDDSALIAKTLTIVIPFFIITGIYIVLNGHVSPGGGFQGGAVLAAIFMCRYLINPELNISLDVFQSIEKVLLLFIILFSFSFLTFGLNSLNLISNKSYIIFMNILIGIKVACGITLIFYRFVFYEDK